MKAYIKKKRKKEYFFLSIHTKKKKKIFLGRFFINLGWDEDDEFLLIACSVMLDNRFTPARLEYFQSRENTHLRISIELAIGQSLTEEKINFSKHEWICERKRNAVGTESNRGVFHSIFEFYQTINILTGTRDTAPYSSRKQLPIKERKITPLCSLLTCKLSSPVWS